MLLRVGYDTILDLLSLCFSLPSTFSGMMFLDSSMRYSRNAIKSTIRHSRRMAQVFP